MSDTPDLSWDAQSAAAPSRPTVGSNLPADETIARPKRALVTLLLALIMLAMWITLSALGWTRLDELQATLTAALPDDLTDDYTAADIDRATFVLLAAIGALGIVFASMVALSARTMYAARSGVARGTLVVGAVLSIPVTLLAAAVTPPEQFELVLYAALVLTTIVVIVLASTPKLSRWLKQHIRHDAVPLSTLRDGASL